MTTRTADVPAEYSTLKQIADALDALIDAFALLMANAPVDYNTLKKIADALALKANASDLNTLAGAYANFAKDAPGDLNT